MTSNNGVTTPGKERNLLRTLLAVVVALAVVSVASAKNTPAPSIAIAPGSTLAFLGHVTFNWTAPKPHGNAQNQIVLACWQDVDNDGDIELVLGLPDIVYSWLDDPSTVFTFSGDGQQSIWSLRGGGPAICEADLDVYTTDGQITELATTGPFNVSG